MKRRLRKKLHLGEFRELCFRVTYHTSTEFSAVETDELLDRFIDMIEANSLQFGGGGGPNEWDGMVELCGRRTATDRHREAVHLWLESQPEVSDIVVGDPTDAWYG